MVTAMQIRFRTIVTNIQNNECAFFCHKVDLLELLTLISYKLWQLLFPIYIPNYVYNTLVIVSVYYYPCMIAWVLRVLRQYHQNDVTKPLPMFEPLQYLLIFFFNNFSTNLRFFFRAYL